MCDECRYISGDEGVKYRINGSRCRQIDRNAPIIFTYASSKNLIDWEEEPIWNISIPPPYTDRLQSGHLISLGLTKARLFLSIPMCKRRFVPSFFIEKVLFFVDPSHMFRARDGEHFFSDKQN